MSIYISLHAWLVGAFDDIRRSLHSGEYLVFEEPASEFNIAVNEFILYDLDCDYTHTAPNLLILTVIIKEKDRSGSGQRIELSLKKSVEWRAKKSKLNMDFTGCGLSKASVVVDRFQCVRLELMLKDGRLLRDILIPAEDIEELKIVNAAWRNAPAKEKIRKREIE